MSGTGLAVARFRGAVSCRREPETPLGLTLVGNTYDRPEETVCVAFSGAAPGDLPEALEDVSVERVDPGIYRIFGEECEWMVAASAVHVHREVASVFYRVVVPRLPRFTRRLFWRVVLAMVRHPTGKRLLLALRPR